MIHVLRIKEESMTSKLYELEKLIALETENRQSFENRLTAEMERTASLEKKVGDLTEQLRKFTKATSVVEAKSVIIAAEKRLISKLFEGEDCDYAKLSDFIEDINDDSIPKNVKQKWIAYKNAWNSKLMLRLIRDLSDARGSIVHDEDCNPEKYSVMSADDVRSILRNALPLVTKCGSRISEAQIEAAVKLHTATIL